MHCPNEFDLQSFFDQELDTQKEIRIKNHLLKCQVCREKIEELDWLKNSLQVLTPVYAPREMTAQNWRGDWKRTAVAACFILGLCFTSWWCLGLNKVEQFSREDELMDQYIILHINEIDGGENV